MLYHSAYKNSLPVYNIHYPIHTHTHTHMNTAQISQCHTCLFTQTKHICKFVMMNYTTKTKNKQHNKLLTDLLSKQSKVNNNDYFEININNIPQVKYSIQSFNTTWI